MILVDTALKAREEQGKPIRVGMTGAGFMGHGLTNQIVNSVPRHERWWRSTTGRSRARSTPFSMPDSSRSAVDTQQAFDQAIENGRPAVTEDAMLLARSPHIDVLVETTGSVEFGAQVLLEAFKHGKHVVLLNAEIDATIGPILQVYAAKHNVVLSACEGDEPGVQINLHRWVRGLGLIPRVIGNIKGLQDPYRTPETQKGIRRKVGAESRDGHELR